MKKLLLLIITISVLSFWGCQKEVVPEAKAMLTSAMDKLIKGDTRAYLNAVLPSQRKKWQRFITRAPYFTTVKNYSYFLDYCEMDDETHAHMLVYMKYGHRTSTSFRTYLVKKDNKWYIDFSKSYDMEKRMNGPSAFSALQYTNK